MGYSAYNLVLYMCCIFNFIEVDQRTNISIFQQLLHQLNLNMDRVYNLME